MDQNFSSIDPRPERFEKSRTGQGLKKFLRNLGQIGWIRYLGYLKAILIK